jgi:SAM-dependent methyltransferase
MNEQLRLRARVARERVRVGELRGEALCELIRAVPWADRDGWVDEMLAIEAHAADVPDLPRGAVPYLPCGVGEILAMVSEVPLTPDDDLVDLGAGLGRVAILGHLLSDARALGIEIQPPLVESARACCAALSLDGVSFIEADAAETDLDGSVFFLYAPFNGAMLERVIDRLAAVARRRRIVICTVGIELSDTRWLVPRAPSHASLALYDAGPSEGVGLAFRSRSDQQ